MAGDPPPAEPLQSSLAATILTLSPLTPLANPLPSVTVMVVGDPVVVLEVVNVDGATALMPKVFPTCVKTVGSAAIA